MDRAQFATRSGRNRFRVLVNERFAEASKPVPRKPPRSRAGQAMRVAARLATASDAALLASDAGDCGCEAPDPNDNAVARLRANAPKSAVGITASASNEALALDVAVLELQSALLDPDEDALRRAGQAVVEAYGRLQQPPDPAEALRASGYVRHTGKAKALLASLAP